MSKTAVKSALKSEQNNGHQKFENEQSHLANNS